MAEEKGINRQVLRLALPSILANITVPLVGLVDMAIAGHIGDAAAIGEKVAEFTLAMLAHGRVPSPPVVAPQYVFGTTFPY